MSQEQDRPQHYVNADLSIGRMNFYEDIARKYSEEYGILFRNFIEDLGLLRRRGDYRIRRVEATGYNILRTISAMDLQSDRRILFYSNGINNIHHFALLLAELEDEGLIDENEVSFGVKSSSVITRKLGEPLKWQPTSERFILRTHKDGEIDVVGVQDTIELVLAVTIRDKVVDEDHAIKLANFFNDRTTHDSSTYIGQAAIEGSWEVPDVRATNNLAEDLIKNADYISIVANMSDMGTARLIVLRDETMFRRAKSEKFPVNEALGKYLVMYNVPK